MRPPNVLDSAEELACEIFDFLKGPPMLFFGTSGDPSEGCLSPGGPLNVLGELPDAFTGGNRVFPFHTAEAVPGGPFDSLEDGAPFDGRRVPPADLLERAE